MGAKRGYGNGQLHVKHGAYYGRWWTSDGRRRQPSPGTRPGQAGLERRTDPRRGRARLPSRTRARRATALPGHRCRPRHRRPGHRRPPPPPRHPRLAQVLPGGLRIDAARAHLPAARQRPSRSRPPTSKRRRRAMLDRGLAPKTVRNVLTFLHSVFEHAIDRGWTRENPVRRRRPGRRARRRRPRPAVPDRRGARRGDASGPRRGRPPPAGAERRGRRGRRHRRRPTSSARCCASSSSPRR